MRIITDIPEEYIEPLKAYCQEKSISRAEAIRRALRAFLPHPHNKELMEFFGMLKGSDFPDGLEYQRAIRAEWDEREKELWGEDDPGF